jgi:hypothetical protein
MAAKNARSRKKAEGREGNGVGSVFLTIEGIANEFRIEADRRVSFAQTMGWRFIENTIVIFTTDNGCSPEAKGQGPTSRADSHVQFQQDGRPGNLQSLQLEHPPLRRFSICSNSPSYARTRLFQSLP